jgi:hypothetical protein
MDLPIIEYPPLVDSLEQPTPQSFAAPRTSNSDISTPTAFYYFTDFEECKEQMWDFNVTGIFPPFPNPSPADVVPYEQTLFSASAPDNSPRFEHYYDIDINSPNKEDGDDEEEPDDASEHSCTEGGADPNEDVINDCSTGFCFGLYHYFAFQPLRQCFSLSFLIPCLAPFPPKTNFKFQISINGSFNFMCCLRTHLQVKVNSIVDNAVFQQLVVAYYLLPRLLVSMQQFIVLNFDLEQNAMCNNPISSK